jgi:hypothetical protein
VDQTDLERLIGELEIAVDRLRSLYEQYFMGIEKIEPMVPRKDVDRRIYVLRKEQIRNTALRFRFHMLLQRYNTYQTHWQRICRDIENGTYKRHVIRAQRRFGSRKSVRPPPSGSPAPAQSLADELAELDREFAPAEMLADSDFELDEEPASPRRAPTRPPPATPRAPPPPRSAPPPRGPQATQTTSGRTPRPPPLRTPRPPPSSARTPPSPPLRTPPPPGADSRAARTPIPPRPAAAPARAPSPPIRRAGAAPEVPPPPSEKADLPDDRVRQLYAQYVETKRRQNESTASITYDAVARSLRESSAKLRHKLGRAVDFEVVVKDGRAVLRPVVK